MTPSEQTLPSTPPIAERVFGTGLVSAERFARMLCEHGVERGLIGPRELDRLWERHMLNSAVLAERIPSDARVIDVGSGGGFPGIPLALARADIHLTLLEPMARRVTWLQEVVDTLELPHVSVVRGRAEESSIRAAVGTVDVVTARAVAPLGKLASWCMPLVRKGGVLLALKGSSAQAEIERDGADVRALGGGEMTVELCGVGILDVPTTVVSVPKLERVDPVVRRSTKGRQRSR